MPDYDALLDQLRPREVFSKFLELTKIPRGSGNEKGVSDYLRAWAEKKGFPVKQDGQHDLLITKPGVDARPDAPTVVLQGHLDMVCVSRPGRDFDFTKQPIEVLVDGDRLRADGTTLGADDGIGVAFALALLDSEGVPHPPLEVVLTTGEETGMYGAAAFDVSWLKGTVFINIDSEEEGVYYASCAGGVRLDVAFPVEMEAAPEGLAAFAVSLTGLAGGHSGVEIDKERGNSHRMTARVLAALRDKFKDIRLADFSGGQADNAIPAATTAVILAKKADRDAIAAELERWRGVFLDELKAPASMGSGLKLELEDRNAPGRALTETSFDKLLFALLTLPTGVAAMDLNNPDQPLPETSSNLAIVGIADGTATVAVSVRSQLASKKEFMNRQIGAIARELGATVTPRGDYPGWEFDPHSRVRPLFARTYEKLTGAKARILGIHAGLECGLFADKATALGRHIDFTSIGPDLRHVHTPDESLGIASVGSTWELLKEVMASLAQGDQGFARI